MGGASNAYGITAVYTRIYKTLETLRCVRGVSIVHSKWFLQSYKSRYTPPLHGTYNLHNILAHIHVHVHVHVCTYVPPLKALKEAFLPLKQTSTALVVQGKYKDRYMYRYIRTYVGMCKYTCTYMYTTNRFCLLLIFFLVLHLCFK